MKILKEFKFEFKKLNFLNYTINKMEIDYKADESSNHQTCNILVNEPREIGGGEENQELTSDELNFFTGMLQTIDRNLQSNNREWIEKSIVKLIDLTKERNTNLNTLIINSDAFSTLCTKHSSTHALHILRLSLNLTAKNPMAVYILINSNIIDTVFGSLKSTDDYVVLTCLKIITNLINSSYFSRICLIASGFFQCAKDFLTSPNRLKDLHYMGKLVEYIIASFFDPTISSNYDSVESKNLGLNDPEAIPELLNQTKKQLSNDNGQYKLNIKTAKQILTTKNGLQLGIREPLWDVLNCMLNKQDSYLINCALVSFLRFSRNPSDAIFIYQNTSLFDRCREICSRESPETIESLFYLFSQFLFIVDKEANKAFIRNGLFEVVINYFNSTSHPVRASAMKCISNCLCYESNLNLINNFFTDETVVNLITSVREDDLSLNEKEEIFFILINLAEVNPQVRLTLFSSEENMELMIDFLNLSSKIVFIELDVLSKLIDSQNLYNIDILDLFIQCNGIETIENLMTHNAEHIAQSAQVFHDRYLKDI